MNWSIGDDLWVEQRVVSRVRRKTSDRSLERFRWARCVWTGRAYQVPGRRSLLRLLAQERVALNKRRWAHIDGCVFATTGFMQEPEAIYRVVAFRGRVDVELGRHTTADDANANLAALEEAGHDWLFLATDEDTIAWRGFGSLRRRRDVNKFKFLGT